MPPYRLRLSLGARVTAAEAAETFLWAKNDRDTFVTRLGPSLGDLGPVTRPNIELVRLAAGVLAADRSTPRRAAGSNWSRREIELTTPVFDPAPWNSISDRLSSLLAFLSGDDWTLQFVKSRSPKERVTPATQHNERVVLLSGGADSAIGALVCRHELDGGAYALVSHVGATNLSPIQRAVATAVDRLLPGGDQVHHQIRLGRARRRVDGRPFPNEFTTRSRSLLFLSLGLAVAAVDSVELWIPENGFASLNPPLGADQRGSVSTRTTHPTFLAGLSELLGEIGVHAVIRNPLERMTKGEMFRLTAQLVGQQEAAGFLTASHSCAHTGHRSFGLSVTQHCGVCFGCLVRRSAFAASGISDDTSYLDSLNRDDLRSYLANKSMVRAVQEFVTRGVDDRDVSSMTLPSSYRGHDALDLIQRTTRELALVV